MKREHATKTLRKWVRLYLQQTQSPSGQGILWNGENLSLMERRADPAGDVAALSVGATQSGSSTRGEQTDGLEGDGHPHDNMRELLHISSIWMKRGDRDKIGKHRGGTNDFITKCPTSIHMS